MSLETRERILGGLWGALVGDALGVPFEFQSRDERKLEPATDMEEFGTHRQPRGTWSDDGSLTLCTADSLIRYEFDTEDIGRRFLGWYREELWTPHGKVFDVGITTSRALSQIASGVRAEAAGEDGQYSNGNGSLMRILPVALRFAHEPTNSLLDRVHRASAVTHRHPRSQMACGFYSLFIHELLAGLDSKSALAKTCSAFRSFCDSDAYWSVEADAFRTLLTDDFADSPESDVRSGGYVIETLEASLWCLLNTSKYEDCVLQAVNLGGDTDTTGCVAGGLAGTLYGLPAIPQRWRSALARSNEIEDLFEKFADKIIVQRAKHGRGTSRK